jgi:hypothetical protein
MPIAGWIKPRTPCNDEHVTREQLLKRLEALSDEQFKRLAPYVEADLESINQLPELLEEIRAGRESAREEPLVESGEVFARARRALSK